MNCKNCGAPVTDGYCEYCGTDYGGNHNRMKEVEIKLKISKLQLAQALQTQYMENLIRMQTNVYNQIS